MRLSLRFLKLLCPRREKERMEFRQDMHRVSAHAENLFREVKRAANWHDTEEKLKGDK